VLHDVSLDGLHQRFEPGTSACSREALTVDLLAKLGLPLLLGILWVFAARKSAKSAAEVDASGEYVVLRHGAIAPLFAALFGGVAVVVAALPLVNSTVPVSGTVFSAVIFGLFALGLWAEAHSTVLLNDHGITTRSLWTGRQSMRWDEVVTIAFLRSRRLFELRSRDGRRLLVRTLLRGIHVFADQVQQRLTDFGGPTAVRDWAERARLERPAPAARDDAEDQAPDQSRDLS